MKRAGRAPCLFELFLGDCSGEDTPVPIPNTEVKLPSADGTARATVWESRSLPGTILRAPGRFGAPGLSLFGAKAAARGGP